MIGSKADMLSTDSISEKNVSVNEKNSKKSSTDISVASEVYYVVYLDVFIE